MRYIWLLWLIAAVLIVGCSSSGTAPAETASDTAQPTATGTSGSPPPTSSTAPTSGAATPIPNFFVPPFNGNEFDGNWVGLTGLQQKLEFEILDGSVTSMDIEFTIPGCNGDSPLGFQFGSSDHSVNDDGFIDMDLGGEYEVSVDARFLSFTDGIGFLEFTDSNPCNVSMATEFTIVPRDRQVDTPPDLRLAERLPTLSIPPELFLEDWKETNPFDSTALIAATGDWLLLRAFESIFPVPKGWAVVTSGQTEATAFFAPGGVTVEGDLNVGLSIAPDPEVNIVFGQMIGSNYADSGVALAEITKGILAPVEGFEFEVLGSDVIDDDRAYLIFSVDNGIDLAFTRIIVMSQMVRTLDASVPAWDLTTVTVNTPRLPDYYPVIRAVLQNWISANDGTVMGVSLPAEVPQG